MPSHSLPLPVPQRTSTVMLGIAGPGAEERPPSQAPSSKLVAQLTADETVTMQR